MAARQDQGLQIALIIFIFLFVGTFVLWYLYFKSASDLTQQVAQLRTELSGAQSQAREFQSENQSYRQMMGFDEVETFENVQQAFDQDMQRFGQTFDESRRFYRDILEYMYQENDKIAAREVDAKEEIKELQERLLAIEAEKEKQVEQFEAQMKKAEEDAADQRNQFARDRASLEATKKELLQNLDTQRAALQGEIASISTKLRALESKLTKSERAVENLLEERAVSAESFEVADGRISWVNPNGTVWINLGEADALRRQITFSVFDAELHDAAKAQKKGSIEVTRILGDHLAEARVTEDDPRNPILTSDQIYSQVWERGKKLRFALTGVIDIDDDRQSDLQLARDLVELNNGAVDSYLSDDGKVVGEMTVATRYLVLGEFPEGTRQGAMREGWQKMTEEAATLGVETISLREFLNQMGYRPLERTVELSRGSGGDFRASPAESDDAPTTFRQRGLDRAPAPTPY